jgi:hypothetical protein
MDARDVALADQALEIVALEARCVTLYLDGLTYKQLLLDALERLQEVTKRADVQQYRIRQLMGSAPGHEEPEDGTQGG